MKRFLKVSIIIAVCAGVFIFGSFIRLKIYDNDIRALTALRDAKQATVDSMSDTTLQSDVQYESDVRFMNEVFDRIFTFYDTESFEKARNVAVTYGLPTDFVNVFYDTAELSSLYADAMLDIVCQFGSADYYLLDRDSDVGYYYVDVTLNTVKYSESGFRLGFFISFQDHGSDNERFKSVIYYNID